MVFLRLIVTGLVLTFPLLAGKKPNLVLLTLDTTRADVLGAYGAEHRRTPHLDALASSGTLYLQAMTASPLTLPAHASLMTGKTPLAHGIHTNGTAALSANARTLAEVLAEQGYDTAAFVASQVLDRRFGLAQGFGFYADEMNAAHLGESGYPEREASAVVEDALLWLSKRTSEKPYFVWLHFYDPHTPYHPRDKKVEGSPFDLYAQEVGRMDSAIGTFLEKVSTDSFVAAVADHGEMLMEHGEEEHGILLYQAALRVPLLIKGPGVPKTKISETAGSVRLPATLLHLLGFGGLAAGFEPPLPGFSFSPAEKEVPVFSEAQMPLTAYDWSPLQALTQGPWRLIVGAEPELHHFINDPSETLNLINERRDIARQMRDSLRALESQAPKADNPLVAQDPDMDAALRSLGYASGSSRPKSDGINPKDGLKMMKQFEEAKVHMVKGRYSEAIALLNTLTQRNPNNIPFLTRLAEARLGAGEVGTALEAYKHAISLNPKLDVLHQNLAQALRSVNDLEGARESFEMVTHLNPRSAIGWLSLAEIANAKGDRDGEHDILHHAMGHGVVSAPLLTRLAQVELGFKKWTQANRALEAATLLEPGLIPAWLLWGDLARAQGDVAKALSRYSQANKIDPNDPTVYLSVGRLYIEAGDQKNAHKYLSMATEKAPGSKAAQEATTLLKGISK